MSTYHKYELEEKDTENNVSFEGDLTEKQALSVLTILIVLTGIVEGIPL
jgi:hypothetical protein